VAVVLVSVVVVTTVDDTLVAETVVCVAVEDVNVCVSVVVQATLVYASKFVSSYSGQTTENK
jgi:hypothetical protein